MAIPPPSAQIDDWVRQGFLQEHTYRPQLFTDAFVNLLPTVESITADVAKLRRIR